MSSTFDDVIDGVSSSVALKAPVRAATTAVITLSGEQTIDGIAVVDGDRVLVKDQATTSANGIYECRADATWVRTKDFDGNRDVKNGTTVLVVSGTTNGETYWRVSTADPIVIGTTGIVWERALVNDGSTVEVTQQGTGAIPRDMQTIVREAIRATGYDGVDNTGTDDSYAGIQASIDAVEEGGCWILPPGDYRISDTLTFRRNASYFFHGRIKPHGTFDDYLVDFGKGTTTDSPGPEGPGNRLTRMEVFGVWLDCEDQSRGVRTHRIDNSSFKSIRVDKVCGSALRATVTRECSFHDFFVWYGADIDTLTTAGRNTEALIDLNDKLDIPAGFGDPNNKIDFYNLTASYCGATTYLSIDTTAGASDVRDIRFFGGQIHYLDDFDVSNTVDYPRYGDSVSRGDDAAVVLIDIQDCQRVAFYGTLVNYPGKAGVCVRVGTSATKLAQYVTFRDLFINNAYVGGTAIGFQIRYGTDIDVAGCMPLIWNGTGTEATYIANFWQDPTGYAKQNVFGMVWVRRNTNGTGLYLDGSKSVGTLSPYIYALSPDGRDLIIRRASGDYADVIVQHTDSSSRGTLRIEGGDKTTPAVDDHLVLYNANQDGGISVGKASRRARAVIFFPLDAEPSDKTSGMVCMADNATWDPLAVAGTDPYLVQYTGTTWKAI